MRFFTPVFPEIKSLWSHRLEHEFLLKSGFFLFSFYVLIRKTQLDLIHKTRLDLIHETRLDLIHETRLDLVHEIRLYLVHETRLDLIHETRLYCAGLRMYVEYITHYSLGMVTRTWSTLYLQRQYLIYTILYCAYSGNV
jgi:hypothetical protein